jgi:hypothetical protein
LFSSLEDFYGHKKNFIKKKRSESIVPGVRRVIRMKVLSSNKLSIFKEFSESSWKKFKSLKFHQNRIDIFLLLIAIGYFLITTYIVSLSNAQVDQPEFNYNHSNRNEKTFLILRDDFMTLLSKWGNGIGISYNTPDYLLYACIVIMVACLFSLKNMAATVLRRTLYIAGTVYAMRAATIVATLLPNPSIKVRTKF